MYFKINKFVIFLLINLFIIPSYSIAAVVLDNSTGNTNTSTFCCFSQSGTETYGHTFTPSSNMNVDAVSFFISKSSGSDSNTQAIKAHLYEYNAGGKTVSGSALASSNEVNISNNTSATEVEATFTSSVTLTSGVTYVVLYTVIGVSGTQSNNRYRFHRSNVNDSQVGGAWYNNHDTDITQTGAFAGSIKLDFKLSFTDTTNPTLTSSVPTDGAPQVGVNSNIVLNFDESVDAETGNITIKKT